MAYSPTAVGSVLGLLSTAMQGATLATQVEFPFNPPRVGLHPSGLPGNVSYPSLLGWHFSGSNDGSGGDGMVPGNTTVVNLSPTALPYTPSGGGAPSATASKYIVMTSPDAAGSALAWASSTTPVRVHVGHTSPSEREILLPPYSVTMITASTASVTAEV